MNPRCAGGVGRQPLRRRALARGRHLLPQRHAGTRVVAGAGGEVEPDLVGLGLVFSAEAQSEQLAAHVGEVAAGVAEAEDCRAELDEPVGRRRLAEALARMLAQRMGDLVAHHDRDLVVVELQLVEQTVVEGDLAARHAERVDLLAADQIDFPVPMRGARRRLQIRRRGVRDDALRDRTQAHQLRVTFGRQRVLLRGLAQHLLVLLRGRSLDLLGRHELRKTRSLVELDAVGVREAGQRQRCGGDEHAVGEEPARMQRAVAGWGMSHEMLGVEISRACSAPLSPRPAAHPGRIQAHARGRASTTASARRAAP